MGQRFNRVKPLFNDAFKKLQEKRVAVVGLGGVGGLCAEALVRSGITKLVIIDFDTVEITNLNRQNVAYESTLGNLKTEVLKKRLMDINPVLDLMVHSVYLDNSNADNLLKDCDGIVDAIDALEAKLDLIEYAVKHEKVFISSMGMGNRMDLTKLKVTTIDKTYNDPFAKQVRLKSKARNLLKFKVVFSTELPTKNPGILTSFMPVTGTAGLLLASEIISDLLKGEGVTS